MRVVGISTTKVAFWDDKMPVLGAVGRLRRMKDLAMKTG
jgi:hypothetical protein